MGHARRGGERAMTIENVAMLATVCLLAIAVWWVDSRALRDLASTPDHQLQRFDRRTWVLLILFLFPGRRDALPDVRQGPAWPVLVGHQETPTVRQSPRTRTATASLMDGWSRSIGQAHPAPRRTA